MKIEISHNLPQLQLALAKAPGQVNFALANALNKTALQAKSEIQTKMMQVFDRPTPWVIKSIGPRRPEDFATKRRLSAEVGFRDKWQDTTDRTMVSPHVEGGGRHYKAMEARLLAMGMIPPGYNAVPGGAAKLDAYGNMSPGQISQLLNVLGTYTESGFNKANIKTRKRLAKGNAKKGVYGFEYFVSYGGIGRTNLSLSGGEMVRSQIHKSHLLPGVYQRVNTGFGTSLKPILIFVKQAKYKSRLDFFGIAKKVVDRDFSGNFARAFDQAVATALLKSQGSLGVSP